ATKAFAAALNVPPPALPDGFLGVGRSAAEPFVLLQAHALLAVVGTGGGSGDPSDLSFRELAAALMGHEERRWRAMAATWDWGGGGPPPRGVQNRAVAALALLGA